METVQKIKSAFERRFVGYDRGDTGTLIRNVIVLKLDGQTRGICIQSVLAKWCCRCLIIFWILR